jgi:hypothetical protein
MTVIKSEMEWTRFKELFEASARSRRSSEDEDEDDDRNFSTVGADLYLDHAIASREASNLYCSDDYELERSHSVSREPSGLLYTDENEIESPQISFAMSDLQFTRSNSLIEDPLPLDDDDEHESIASLVATSTINHTFVVQLDDLPYLGQQQASEGSFEIRVRQAELEMETSERSICASPTGSSLGGVADDDDSRENSDHSVDYIGSNWSHDEIISTDEAIHSATGYKTATPSSSLESVEEIIEERVERCVDFGNSENECDMDIECENENKQHLRWFGHGKPWTLIAILVSWAGVLLSAYSRNSLQFVTLDEPFLIDSNFDYLDSIGMIRIQVCYNETVVGKNGCQVIDLSPDIVDDSRFEAARGLLTLGLWFGIFFATVLSSAIYWESINLRPIGFGLLFTYFCQSCAMIFFDTELCAKYTCRPGAGCIYCIVASFCWITACGATAKMDAIKSRYARRRRRQALREASKAAKAIRKKRDRETKAIRKKLERETSSATEQTASTTSSSSSQHTADIESGEDSEIQMRNVQLNREASSATDTTTSESTSMYEC